MKHVLEILISGEKKRWGINVYVSNICAHYCVFEGHFNETIRKQKWRLRVRPAMSKPRFIFRCVQVIESFNLLVSIKATAAFPTVGKSD